MTLEEYQYESDSSLPEEFKNTNRLNPIIHGDSDQDEAITSNRHQSGGDFGTENDWKQNSRQRAQKASKSREKATQSYIQKKLKQIEQEDREKQKEQQRRKKTSGKDNDEEEEEKSDDGAEAQVVAVAKAESESESESDSDSEEEENRKDSRARANGRSKGHRGNRQQNQKTDRSKSRGQGRSKSRPVSDSEGLSGSNKDKSGYDIIDRSNKRASRHRRPEDEILEPIVKSTASIQLEDEKDQGEQEEEEEEHIRFKHNLGFKTDDVESMVAKPLTSRDFKKIFEQQLTERDEAREKQKEKEKEKEKAKLISSKESK
ncbi:hypothetical protein BGZ83_003654 [Gryganskiella cystojenkinii]|nr:hypothetical protein BGZ83_003654 [Gryganskiella cystojenkinii]